MNPNRVYVQLVVFCYKDIHVDRNENEDNRRVSLCPQSTTSESLAVNMTQQIEMRAIGKTTEMADKAYEGLPIYQSIKRNIQR